MSYRDGPRWGGGAPGRRSPALGQESLSGGAGRSHRCLAGSAPRPGWDVGSLGTSLGGGQPPSGRTEEQRLHHS